jgi:hypothetical protein
VNLETADYSSGTEVPPIPFNPDLAWERVVARQVEDLGKNERWWTSRSSREGSRRRTAT